MAFKMAEGYVELSQRGFGGVLGAIGGIKRRLLSLINPMNAVAGAMAAIGASVGVVSLLKLASDAEEVEGKFSAVFRNTTKEARELADTLKNYLGASTTEVKKSLSDMGDLFKPLGFAEADALQLSGTMTRLAGDLASFSNMSMDEALRRLQGTLVGSHENALKFGVVINENVLKAKMAEEGTAKLTGKAFELAKVQARLNLLMEGTSDAQGDLGRTGGSLANMWKRLSSTAKDVGEFVGKELVEAFNLEGLLKDTVDFAKNFKANFGDTIRSVLEKVADVAKFTWTAISTLAGWIRNLWEVHGPLIQRLLMASAVLTGLVVTISAVTAVVGALSVGIAFLLSPIGLVLAAIAGLFVVFGGVFDGMLDTVIAFARDWDLYLKLMWEGWKLWMSNSWERIKTFFINIGETLVWFFSNWKNVFTDIGNFTVSVFDNTWNNIKEGWNETIAFISGSDYTPNYKPLLDGFKSTLSQFPALTKAAILESTPEIDKLNRDLLKRQNARNKTQAQKAAEKRPDVGAGAAAGGVPGGGAAAGQEKLVGRFSAEALVSKMQNAAFKAMEKKDDPNRELVNMAKGEGIPVRIGKANGGGEQAAAAAAWG